MKKPELLAPAGSPEHFKAAVENGADAIYFGGKGFNARQYADNFTFEEIVKSVRYAHNKGVKVYMTVNTLVKQSEFEELILLAGEGASAGIDAFIVQDMGVASVLKRRFPEVPLHLSTQGTVYDIEGVKFVQEAGFKRVVLAREMSLENIIQCSKENIETEVFVHGALCMCLSGQCAMSSLIGDRSGNRGSCAQPCRKWYSLEDGGENRLGDGGYLLSPKDISYLSELDQILGSGVSSLKIEGRLKTPEYAALTVSMFRKYIDEVWATKEKPVINKEDSEKLEQVFSRGGFTKGYLYGKQNGGLLSGESPKHRGLFLGIVKNIKPSSVNKDKKVVEIDIKRSITVGDGIEIIGKGFPGGVVTFISGKKGNVRSAEAGEKIWLGDIQGSMRKGDMVYKVSDKELLRAIRNTYERADTEKITVKGRFYAAKGRPAVFTVTDDMGRTAKAEGDIMIEEANNAPTGRESILKQLSKTGNTPYELTECHVEMEEGLMIPLSEVKKVRRKALEMLQDE